MVRRVSVFVLAFMMVATFTAGSELEKGRALNDAGNGAEAEKVLIRLWNDNKPDAEVAYELGRAMQLQRKFGRAEQYYTAAINQSPRNSKYHTAIGGALGMQAQEASLFGKASLAKRAKEHLETAVSLDPNNLEARQALLQYYLVAPSILGGSEKKAREQAAEIQKRDVVEGVQAFALIHMRAKEFDAAEKLYRDAIQQRPADPELKFSYGLFLQQRERWSEAFAQFDAIVKQTPDLMKAWYQIGRTAAMSGQRLTDGEAALKKYLALQQVPKNSPSLAWAHCRLAQVYEKANKKDLAKNHYKTALALDPKIEVAREALKKL